MKKDEQCYLCGLNVADSFDHVPPKNIFPKDFQKKGYKIPACSACNNLLHLDEEYIRDRFSIIGKNQIAREVFTNGTKKSYLRTYETDKRVSKLDLIIRDVLPLAIKSPQGIFLGNATGIKIDSKRVERVSIKIVKGLFFHHFKKIIPNKYIFHVYFDPPNLLPELVEKQSPIINRFGDAFCYKGILTKGDMFMGIWWLSFYASIGLIVVVENPKIEKL